MRGPVVNPKPLCTNTQEARSGLASTECFACASPQTRRVAVVAMGAVRSGAWCGSCAQTWVKVFASHPCPDCNKHAPATPAKKQHAPQATKYKTQRRPKQDTTRQGGFSLDRPIFLWRCETPRARKLMAPEAPLAGQQKPPIAIPARGQCF